MLVMGVSTKANVVWGAFILGDASMSSFWYVQVLNGMVHHPCYPQGCLGGCDVVYVGAWSDVSAHAASKPRVDVSGVR